MPAAGGNGSPWEERIMNDMSLTNLQNGITMVSAGAIEAFAGRLRGRVLIATDAAYDEARTIWNGMAATHRASCRGGRPSATLR